MYMYSRANQSTKSTKPISNPFMNTFLLAMSAFVYGNWYCCSTMNQIDFL